jgi:hypothetical protein
MAELFLEDQLKRIREMTEWMSRATARAAELNDELIRSRETGRQGPLNEVRDFRTYSSTPAARPAANESRERSESDAGSTRRHTARESTRRRR